MFQATVGLVRVSMCKVRLHSKQELLLSNQGKLNRSARIKTFPSCNSGKRNGEEYIQREKYRREGERLLKPLVNDCIHDKRGLQQHGVCTKGKVKAHASLFGLGKSQICFKKLNRYNYTLRYGNKLIDRTNTGQLVNNSTTQRAF